MCQVSKASLGYADVNVYGKEFVRALHMMLKVRKERRMQYGDIYLDDPFEAIVWMLHHKLRRVKHLMMTKKETDYEKLEDTLIDTCIYSLFGLAILCKEREK